MNVLDEECPALFQATMEAAQVGIFVLDDGRFIYVNPFFCQMFVYSAEELLTRRLPIDLVMPEQR